jgi:hypothetical protein
MTEETWVWLRGYECRERPFVGRDEEEDNEEDNEVENEVENEDEVDNEVVDKEVRFGN